ncbi:chemotaxis protein CheV, partial [bacterium]|nr:chemotaxis protein CheV [bacterium]
MQKGNKSDILLESGTNELEIVEFGISGNIYGINVAKVREIIKYPDHVISLPDAHPSSEGIVDLRGKIVPIINLPKHLGETSELDKSTAYVIISEFNNFTVGFCVHRVERIHRLSWTQIEPPIGALSSEEGVVTAIIKFDDKMVLLLDFEKITSDVNPGTGMDLGKADDIEARVTNLDRTKYTVLIAEDSGYILKIIVKNLQKAGYKVLSNTDGQQAWDRLQALIKSDGFQTINDHIDIVVSDIEMPKMDGLHLIKNIKTTPALKDLPCVVFSSLITP